MKTETNHTLEVHKVAGHRYQLRTPRSEPVQSVSPLDRVTRLVAETYTAEDAAFIVRACNSHETLLNACRMALQHCEPGITSSDVANVRILREAIALASQEGK